MCTVTFLPKGASAYLLTSNRDEAPNRAALTPQHYEVHGQTVLYPKDPLANGTWIATDQSRFTLCLLNGALEKHKHTPPYKLSRGLMLLSFFKYLDVTQFAGQFDFSGIAPFTLLIVDSENELKLTELIWDENELHVTPVDVTKAHIWSSSTLYPAPVRAERMQWFKNWLNSHDHYDQNTIMEFHKTGGKGDHWNDFVMNREGKVQTVSVTSIEKADHFNMIYEDLLS
jgi:uncharacterized protein with NRDE domain